MQRKSKGMELLKQVPSLPAGKAMDGFVEEGAFGRVIRFGFQGNRKTQGREEGNTGKRKVQLCCPWNEPDIKTKGRQVGKSHWDKGMSGLEGARFLLTPGIPSCLAGVSGDTASGWNMVSEYSWQETLVTTSSTYSHFCVTWHMEPGSTPWHWSPRPSLAPTSLE